MKNSAKNKISLSNLLLTIFVIFFLICMISQPARFISKSLEGVSAWAFNVLPSVLPFMFFTRVLSALDFMPTLTRPLSPISKKLFKTPSISIYAFTMAILSGYPVGSKMIADLYLQRKITKQDAFKMSSFCSTSGPMFIVGAVGIGMFKNATIGYILFISHIFGAILNGIAFRNLKIKEERGQAPESQEQAKSTLDLSEIVLNSTLSILSVGCIITIFFIVIECFSPLLSLLPQNIAYFFEGLIEITKGCLDLATTNNTTLAVILSSFVISFGGISTLLQSITMLSKLKMPTKLFAFQKFSHACFSCLTTIFLLFIFKI